MEIIEKVQYQDKQKVNQLFKNCNPITSIMHHTEMLYDNYDDDEYDTNLYFDIDEEKDSNIALESLELISFPTVLTEQSDTKLIQLNMHTTIPQDSQLTDGIYFQRLSTFLMFQNLLLMPILIIQSKVIVLLSTLKI